MDNRCPSCRARNPEGAAWCGHCRLRFDAPAAGSGGQRQAAPQRFGGSPATLVAPPAFIPPPAPIPAALWRRFCAWVVDDLLASMLGAWLAGSNSAPALLTSLAILVVYQTLMLSTLGQTVGKLLFGVRVVRSDGDRLGPPAALLRSTVLGLTTAVPVLALVNGILLAKDEDHQGWHDKLAGTIVVRRRRR